MYKRTKKCDCRNRLNLSNRWVPWWVLLSAFFLFGCGIKTLDIRQDSINSTTSRDIWPTDNWSASSPEAQGMDSNQLASMLAEIKTQNYRIDSVAIVRNGVLVLDAYHFPFKPKKTHIIHSCTKSLVSALIGIAIREGYIESIEQPVLSFFPDRKVSNLDADKQAMKLEHLLTMTSGFNSRDSYLYRWEGLDRMRQSQDWVNFVLDLPMVTSPGDQFEYCNGCSFLLSAIIQETTGMSTLDFARKYLFDPIGISEVTWPANMQGVNIGWGEMYLQPLDMAKFGYLYLKNGVWNGVQIIPPDWVALSTKKIVDGTLEDGYGYQWWVDDSGYYMALGYAGQFIFVIPEKELVVVFTSDLPESQFYTPQQLLETYIFPAVLSNKPLPEDAAALHTLETQLEALTSP